MSQENVDNLRAWLETLDLEAWQARMEMYSDRDEALAAAGLSE